MSIIFGRIKLYIAFENVYTISEVIPMAPRGGKREGSGRPALAGERREIHSIKFAPDEWKQIQEKAKDAGISASEYVRQKALQD